MIPLFDLHRQRDRLWPCIDERLNAVLRHGRFVLGPEVEALEARLADYTGSRHVVTVSSGRDALYIALRADGVGPGDAVFVPAFTFSSTAEVVVACGATPVFVDIDARTFNIDIANLMAAVESTRRRAELTPKAIIAVDLFGLPADYQRLGEVASANGLLLIADAAQSFGGRLGERKVGTLAPVTAVSFYPTKPLGAYGDGGALFTDDAARAELYRQIRINGRGLSGLQESDAGLTGRLDTMQAAILLCKLEVFDDELRRRRSVAARYDDALAGLVAVPVAPDGAQSAHALYTVRCEARDSVAGRLAAAEVGCNVYYPAPLHLHPAFRRFGDGVGSLPVAEAASRHVLSLPMHPYLRDEEVDAVCRAVRTAVA